MESCKGKYVRRWQFRAYDFATELVQVLRESSSGRSFVPFFSPFPRTLCALPTDWRASRETYTLEKAAEAYAGMMSGNAQFPLDLLVRSRTRSKSKCLFWCRSRTGGNHLNCVMRLNCRPVS